MRLRLKGLASAAIALASGQASLAAPADLLLVNGHVLTVDRQFSIAKAVAVKDGRIIAVGGDEIAKTYQAPTTIDLAGRTLMPGFTDTHVHIVSLGPRQIDVAKARSVAEVQAMLREKAKALDPGEWITGYGWDEALLAEKRNLTRADLDAGAPDNPVILTRSGFHSSVSNSQAFKIAQITRQTPDPERGVIERGPDGEPNGIIRERGDLVSKFVPADTPQSLRPGQVQALKDLTKLGITSLITAGSTINDEIGKPLPVAATFLPSILQLKSIYAEYGAELPRMTANVIFPGVEELKRYPRRTGEGDDRLRIGAIGEAPGIDGGFTGPTAFTLADYKGQPGFRGRRSISAPDLDAMLDVAGQQGWQVGIHAIGDAAIVIAADAYHKALTAHPGPTGQSKDRRWYLGHFTVMPPASTMQLMAKDGVAITQQPNFSYTLEGRYMETLDEARVDHANAVATPLRYGIRMAFGGDNLPIDPRVGLYAATTRKGMSGAVHGADEAVSRSEAIRLYTATASYLTWEESQKGTLEAGKFADMIVLDRDPLTVPEAELLTMNVDMTFIGGRLVFTRAQTAR